MPSKIIIFKITQPKTSVVVIQQRAGEVVPTPKCRVNIFRESQGRKRKIGSMFKSPIIIEKLVAVVLKVPNRRHLLARRRGRINRITSGEYLRKVMHWIAKNSCCIFILE